MIYIFKTSVKTKQEEIRVGELLSKHQEIINWNFDLEDCDHILRINSLELRSLEIIHVLVSNGFECEEL